MNGKQQLESLENLVFPGHHETSLPHGVTTLSSNYCQSLYIKTCFVRTVLFTAELVFDGSVWVTSGDNFVPSLGNNSSTAFKEMALKYQNMVSPHTQYF
jgi:hypothetical protein